LEDAGQNVELVPLNAVSVSYLQQMPTPAGCVLTDILDYSVRIKSQSQINLAQQWHTTFLNDPHTWDLTHNKLLMYQHLQSCGISVPNTVACATGQFVSKKQAEEIFDQFDGQAVVKPAYGWYGKNTYLVNSTDDLVDKITQIQVQHGVNVPIVIQEYVGNYRDIVLRVNYCRDYIGCYARIVSPFEEEKFNNDNKFKYRVPIAVPCDLKNYVLSVMQSLGVDAASCDVLISNNGYKITDVNTPGSFRVHDGICRANFASHLANRLMQKIELSLNQRGELKI
jgi:glutathione synthase/RimK-type ligase-like ATP-grasp enzyme